MTEHAVLERLVQGQPFIIALMGFALWILWNSVQKKDSRIEVLQSRIESLQRETLTVVGELKSVIASQQHENRQMAAEFKSVVSALTEAIHDNLNPRRT